MWSACTTRSIRPRNTGTGCGHATGIVRCIGINMHNAILGGAAANVMRAISTGLASSGCTYATGISGCAGINFGNPRRIVDFM